MANDNSITNKMINFPHFHVLFYETATVERSYGRVPTFLIMISVLVDMTGRFLMFGNCMP